MEGAAEALRLLPSWAASGRTGCLFVMLAAHMSLAATIGKHLAAKLGRGNVVLAVADHTFSTLKSVSGVP